jgi:hypothetical protein
MEKIYKKFKVKEYDIAFGSSTDYWVVVDDPESELKIVKIPSWLKHPKAVATAIAKSLSEGKYALTDLI